MLKVLQVQEKLRNEGSKPEMQNSNKSSSVLTVKTKHKDRRYALLKRLMLFGLKPSLRMAALKMLMCKKKKLLLCDLNSEDVEGKHLFGFFLFLTDYK